MAPLILIRRVGISRLAKSASNSSIAVAEPDTTQSSGELTAASERFTGMQANRSASESATLSIPASAERSMICPRSETMDSASGSDITPARHAAAYSPRLWPVIASGWTPQDIQSRARAISVMKIAGSWSDGRARRAVAGPSHSTGGNITLRTACESSASKADRHSSMQSR